MSFLFNKMDRTDQNIDALVGSLKKSSIIGTYIIDV